MTLWNLEVPSWELRDMTVCIAAVCEENTDDRKIVLCTDRKISSALGSAETTLKSRSLGVESWRVLTSGADRDIQSTLRLLKQRFSESESIDETNVLSIVRAALNQRKKDKADELVNGRLAISYSEFLERGKKKLPKDIFRAITAEVELTKIDAEFVIVGYAYGFPILLKTDGNCGASIREHFAFAGEGAYLAQAALLSRAHNHLETLGRTIYSVYEAKKFSQGAPSVGEETSITILHQDGRHNLVSTTRGLAFLEEQYQKFGPKKVSRDLKVSPELVEKLATVPPREPKKDSS